MAHDKYFAICENKCLVDITHLEHSEDQYVGNGSANERVINIGGVGDMLLITSANGMVIATAYGAICKPSGDASVGGLTWSEIMFDPSKNTLKLKSSDKMVNSTGGVYKWRRL